MSPSSLAIADTCFLIDWSRYRRRHLLFEVFRAVYVPEEVLNEVRSEALIAWISENLRRDRLALYTSTRDELNEARGLVEASRLRAQIPSIDLPEAVCLVAGKRRGYVVLTENRGALLAPRYIDEYRGVAVWRSLEVLLETALRGLVDYRRPEELFEEYSQDTLHLFPAKALKQALEKLVRKLDARRAS